MKAKTKSAVLRLIGIAFAILPPIFATLSYFPLWKNRGTGAIISGISLLFILLSVIPAIKLLKRFLASPTATTMWFILFVIFFLLANIAEQMAVICLVGFLGNLVAATLWRFAGRSKE